MRRWVQRVMVAGMAVMLTLVALNALGFVTGTPLYDAITISGLLVSGAAGIVDIILEHREARHATS